MNLNPHVEESSLFAEHLFLSSSFISASLVFHNVRIFHFHFWSFLLVIVSIFNKIFLAYCFELCFLQFGNFKYLYHNFSRNIFFVDHLLFDTNIIVPVTDFINQTIKNSLLQWPLDRTIRKDFFLISLLKFVTGK